MCLFFVILINVWLLVYLRITRIHWLDWRIVRKQLDIMPTYHYVQNQGKLMMQSWENGQKPQFGQFFDNFEVKCLQIANFSATCNFRPETKRIVRAVFEKNIKVSDCELIWRPFREYLQIKVFFQKSGSVTFLPL